MPFQKGDLHPRRNKTLDAKLIADAAGNRFGGKRTVRSSAFVKSTPSKVVYDEPEDEEMGDEDGEEERVIYDDEEVEDDGGEEAGTPAQGESGEEEDEDAPPTITAMPARKRIKLRARGGTSRRSTRGGEFGTPQPDGDAEEGSESGTPNRRRPARAARGRTGGFRGRRRGGATQQQADVPRQVVDKNGVALDIVNEEIQVDDDEEGNAKVDANGNLQGEREYRVRTFTVMGKEDRLYMLSTEPARCCGFRDSYLFFAKHPKLWKVLLDEDQKLDLIARGVLPSSYKGRNIGVVTARSVYREFGAKIIVGGRRITDDYKVAEARERGDAEGELADPDDRIPENVQEYDRNRYVAWFGASDVYKNAAAAHAQAVGAAAASGKAGAAGKRKTGVTLGNWQFMHAREASRFNSLAAAARKANLDGIYDAHTNMMLYPQIMQPTHVKWEQIPPPSANTPRQQRLTNGHSHATNGSSNVDVDGRPNSADSTIFNPVPAVISCNFAILDTHFTAPSLTSHGYPGPDSEILDPNSGPNGLSSISDDILGELPEDCRRAFEQVRKEEQRWKTSWGAEGESGLRGHLRVGLNGYPV
ncbi:chromatin structure-remodeling complex subunit RSC7 [Elasticomyces elasticus]|nr:chromatin structure-remodeling complex subunit RSC7 [Elasticomyces elasticus]